jgi:hypothetical protein
VQLLANYSPEAAADAHACDRSNDEGGGSTRGLIALVVVVPLLHFRRPQGGTSSYSLQGLVVILILY